MSVNPTPAEPTQATQDSRKGKVYAEQIRLLYTNANSGVWITLCVASVLGSLQWGVISHPVVLAWLMYMLAISAVRFALARRYWDTPATDTRTWANTFTVGTCLSAMGWGAASVLLYPEAHLANQVILAFVVGGMILGAGSILASRPEAFVAFIIPAGLPLSARLVLQGDGPHLAMGLLTTIFTVATLITTWRIHLTLRSSLNLQFENKDLVADLQNAKNHTETLNQELEIRVRERTAELHKTNERLRTEIEQRKQTEEELLRARKMEALGVLAGGIAHDFNNFLTIVQGNLGLAKMELGSDTPVRAILDQTAAACQRAATLAAQLLTFSKGGVPVRRIVSVSHLVRDAVDLVRAGANVSINIDIADNLWAAQVDASQIGSALHNILLNARQAMPDGGIIDVRAENVFSETGSLPLGAGKYIRITVRDYGCGVLPDNLPRIFDPYFTTKRAGTGLGLAAAHAIVAKHEGHITVQSEVGVQTTFSVYLPASEQTVTAEQANAEVAHTGTGRILVMDDEEALRRLLKGMLERLGYEAECARDGAEAIVLFERAETSGRGFDAVLLDLTVPGGIGGMEVVSRLREIGPSAKLIVSSGYSNAPVMSDFRRYGFDEVIPKPWTPTQISEVFKRILLPKRAHSRNLR